MRIEQNISTVERTLSSGTGRERERRAWKEDGGRRRRRGTDGGDPITLLPYHIPRIL